MAVLALAGTACRRTDPDATTSHAVAAEPVRFSVASGVVIAGVLERPTTANASARPPVVLFIGGTGPQDRDGARDDLAGYRPFAELAADVRALGFATLRIDERGTGASTGTFAGTTTYGFAGDVAAALTWLRTRTDVDGAHAVLVGHSEGALIALLVARRDTNVRALVLLGAAARDGRALARWQRYALVHTNLSVYPSDEQPALLARSDSAAEMAAARDPWLAAWFGLDPLPIAADVHVPLLLVHGANDRQVPATDAQRLADAVRDGVGHPRDDASAEVTGASGVMDRADVTVAIVPRANHLLLEDDSGEPEGYARLASRRLIPSARASIRAWLDARRQRVRME